ncbi:hypothetical protein [Paraburkholderia sp. GAS334]|jgi:hypothetical protein|uniref:hypothetical protein n=1 Tax=unclassified Paraburkholderia TaxID=2615204 RepID=UPI003D1BAC92
MTYAMYGVAGGMTLIFSISLYWYRKNLIRRQEIRWLDEHHVLDRLRARLEL